MNAELGMFRPRELENDDMRSISMRLILSATVASIALLVLTPIVLACVRPRTLDEQMLLAGDEVVVGQVVGIEERWAKEMNGESVLWTLVNFRVEESLVSGTRDYDLKFFFRGGIRPGSPSTTITPSSEDVREGRKLLVFLALRKFGERTFGPGVYQVDSYAEVYRIQAFTDSAGTERQVVLGKGGGFAFQENERVADAKTRVAQAAAKRQRK
jgi:hypothetical protein